MLDVGEADPLDPLDGDALEVDARAEGDRGEERELLRRVDAADVERRVGLGVARALRLLEHLRVGRVLGLHPGQDVVAGAVHHPHEPGDGVAGEPLGQRLDHRDAARDRRLEAQRHARRLGRLRQRLAVPGQHRLVGGDEVLAGADRRLGRRLRRPVLAADHLDDEVDVAAPRERHRVVLPGVAREVDAAVAVAASGPRPRRSPPAARRARRWSPRGSRAAGPRRRRRCRARRGRCGAVRAWLSPAARTLLVEPAGPRKRRGGRARGGGAADGRAARCPPRPGRPCARAAGLAPAARRS